MSLHTSTICCIDQKWRRENGLHPNPTSFGPLTNLPDYTFMDGRPTPLGVKIIAILLYWVFLIAFFVSQSRQKRRLLKQRELAATIVQMSAELDFAKQRHQTILREKEEKRERIIQNKLKPKGHLLLKQSK